MSFQKQAAVDATLSRLREERMKAISENKDTTDIDRQLLQEEESKKVLDKDLEKDLKLIRDDNQKEQKDFISKNGTAVR